MEGMFPATFLYLCYPVFLLFSIFGQCAIRIIFKWCKRLLDLPVRSWWFDFFRNFGMELDSIFLFHGNSKKNKCSYEIFQPCFLLGRYGLSFCIVGVSTAFCLARNRTSMGGRSKTSSEKIIWKRIFVKMDNSCIEVEPFLRRTSSVSLVTLSSKYTWPGHCLRVTSQV